MSNFPLNKETVKSFVEKNKIKSVGTASIREVKKLINDIEEGSGMRFIRMEMGIPGLPASEIGINAEIEALRNGCASIYPDIYGTAELKDQISLFVKNFVGLNVSPDCCLPTVGSMQGGFAAFLTTSQMDSKKKKVLFIDPGFPVQKQQCAILGLEKESFDVYDYRGEKLRAKLESYLSKGDIACMLYSSPNNPSWICFTEEELMIIGELANKYGVVVIEDLAYFAMDFRKDYSKPGVPPYQPTVGNYTKNFILLISSSKAFNYAGQRIGMMVISPELFNSPYDGLMERFGTKDFGKALVFGSLYCLSSGTSHSPQYALTAMLKAVNEGRYDFVKEVREYGEKATIMKKMFTDNNFKIVYDKDLDEPVADGFYFTFCYPGFDGDALLEELLRYGISAIALGITGSMRTEGIRACVSLIQRSEFPELERRLTQFRVDHPIA